MFHNIEHNDKWIKKKVQCVICSFIQIAMVGKLLWYKQNKTLQDVLFRKIIGFREIIVTSAVHRAASHCFPITASLLFLT